MADISPSKENGASRDSRWGNPPDQRKYDPRWGAPSIGESTYSTDRLSKPYQVRPLTPGENSKMEQVAHDPKQFDVTRQLLSKEELQPTNLLTIGERRFFVGKIINSGYLVMFYEDPATKKLMPRIIDHSHSGRSWRSSPGIYGAISKGIGIHYTQETKAHKNIIRYINWALSNGHVAEHSGDVMEDYFSLGQRGAKAEPAFYTFEKEIARYDDKGVLRQFQKYRAGHLDSSDVGKDTNLSEEFRNFDFTTPQLKAFLPNFGNPPIETDILAETDYSTYPSSLKRDGVRLETYPAQLNGRPIEWVMAYDREGRVWIERIAFLDREVNSYGVMPEFIDIGCLGSKPFDYSQQTSTKNGDYVSWDNARQVDITPLLDNFLPVQQFRKAKRIAPYRTPGAIGRLTVENTKNFDELKLALAKGRWERTKGIGESGGNNDPYYWNEELADIVNKASRFEGLDRLPQKIPGLKDAIERIRKQQVRTLEQSKDFHQLYEALDGIGGIQGSDRYFPSWELKSIIDRVRKKELTLAYVTGDMALRRFVEGLLNGSK